ncbi:MAG: hypothetical protein ABIO70_19150 [Pseudomonadota bacterium]
MTYAPLPLLLSLGLVLCGCADGQPPAGEDKPKAALDLAVEKLAPWQQHLFERAKADLGHIESKSKSTAFNPQYFCVSVDRASQHLAPTSDAALQEFLTTCEQVCGHDAWVRFAEPKAKALDAGTVEKKELGKVCDQLQQALEGVGQAHSADADVAPIKAAWDEHCLLKPAEPAAGGSSGLGVEPSAEVPGEASELPPAAEPGTDLLPEPGTELPSEAPAAAEPAAPPPAEG